jgi:hypothetical protein
MKINSFLKKINPQSDELYGRHKVEKEPGFALFVK